jgi:hypothetical protein
VIPSSGIAYGNENLPEASALSGNEWCDSVSDAISELAAIADTLSRRTDLSQVGTPDCLSPELSQHAVNGLKTVSEVLMAKTCELLDKISELKQRKDALPQCECNELSECD